MLRLLEAIFLLGVALPLSASAYLVFQLGPVAVGAQTLSPGEALLRMAALGALPLALLAAAAHALLGRVLLVGGLLTRSLTVAALCFLYGALAWGVAKGLPLVRW